MLQRLMRDVLVSLALNLSFRILGYYLQYLLNTYLEG